MEETHALTGGSSTKIWYLVTRCFVVIWSDIFPQTAMQLGQLCQGQTMISIVFFVIEACGTNTVERILFGWSKNINSDPV